MRKHLGWLITFITLLLFHAVHDFAWFWVGRFTELNIQSTIPAILVVTLALTILSRVLGRHVH